MPAFQLKQFEQQLEQLLRLFALPTAFHEQLTRLFERYEQPSYRYGVGVKELPEPAYHIQSAMLERMETELRQMASERPRSAVLLAQACWQDEFYETKYIAAIVMGSAPLFDLNFFIDAFLKMLFSAQQKEHQRLLFSKGAQRLRDEQFSMLVELIEKWLDDTNLMQYGFSALQSIIDAGEMEHLPTIFRLIEKFVIEGAESYQQGILRLMDGLAGVSPVETAHFLSDLTQHFYGEERMRYFRALCRSFEKPQRDFIFQSFMGETPLYYEEDIIDD